jgi:hypothetical protein
MREIGISPRFSRDKFVPLQTKQRYSTRDISGKVFTTHFPTIVPQMWLLQTVLTSNGLVCENWVLNFVLHSVGHFQKRELAIEPKICHPYCPILGLVNV